MLEELIRITLNSKTPFITTALYLLYTVFLNKKFRNSPSVQRELYSGLTFMMVLHNLIMSGFSFVVFKNSFFILVDFYRKFGLHHFINDPELVLYRNLEFYLWIFYVSKYVEIFDTIIIHLNGRKTSFLQIYHHAGAIICCWMLCTAHTHVAWIFVVFNSFVHTFMYFYYCLTTMRVQTKFKKTITYLQLTQFVLGSSLFGSFLAFGEIFSKDPILRSFQYMATLSNLAYVAGLFFMFKSFARRTYSRKARQEKKKSA